MGFLNWLTFAFRRQPRRPLAARRPDRAAMGQSRRTPLGMEATDLALVDRVTRRNDALERTGAVRQEDRGSYTARTSLHVEAMPEDETYARRFYGAHVKKGGPDE